MNSQTLTKLDWLSRIALLTVTVIIWATEIAKVLQIVNEPFGFVSMIISDWGAFTLALHTQTVHNSPELQTPQTTETHSSLLLFCYIDRPACQSSFAHVRSIKVETKWKCTISNAFAFLHNRTVELNYEITGKRENSYPQYSS